MPEVSPAILRWARETAGLTLDDAAEKLDLREARGVSGGDRLAALEAGDNAPSRPLLLKMAKQYRRSLLTFYLPAPPRTGERGQDFRTLPPEQSRRDAAMVDALIRDVRTRQEMVKGLLQSEDEAVELPFVGSMSMRDGADAVLRSIVAHLAINVDEFRHGNNLRGFGYLRDRVERAGIFVLLMGNLGSHHSNIDVEHFRGFALADSVAPFIVINDQDAPAAWSFTLLHELTHIWLGQTGVSGQDATVALETFCNDVATNFLLPADDMAAAGARLQGLASDDLRHEVTALADARYVSSSMVAYRLHRLGFLSREAWQQLSAFYRAQWLAARTAQRERNRERDGGPNYYLVRRHRLGSRLIGLTRRMIEEGVLVPSRAAKMLGVRPANVYGVIAVGDPQHRA